MLRRPESIGLDKLSDLSDFLREYPYSQTFRVLYLKTLRNVSDLRYETELVRTSLYVSNRRALYDLIYKNKERKENVDLAINSKVEDNLNEGKDVCLSKDSENQPNQSIDIIAQLEQMKSIDTTLLKKNSNKKREDLIDNFLAESETKDMTIKVDESSDTQYIENRTLTQNMPEFCTETLAKLYIKQKKFDSAIKIFQRLCLKNPEKSVYFADQIRFFERLMENL